MALLCAAYRWRVRQLHHQFEMTLDARVGERTRIARELHDTLLQSAHGVLLRFQTVSQLLPERPDEAKEKLDSAIEQTARLHHTKPGMRCRGCAIRQPKPMIWHCRSALLEKNSRRTQPATALHSVWPLRASREICIPSSATKCIRLLPKHCGTPFCTAQAKQVEVEIRYDNERFRLRVRDDGKGIDAAILSSAEPGGTLRLAGHAGTRHTHGG